LVPCEAKGPPMFAIRNTVPTRSPAVVTWILIVINCAVFLLEISLPARSQGLFLVNFSLIPSRYFSPQAPGTGGGVAWWAHVGGFIAKLAFGNLLTPPTSRYRSYYADEGIYGFTPDGFR